MSSDIATIASFGVTFAIGFLIIFVYAVGFKQLVFAKRARKRRKSLRASRL